MKTLYNMRKFTTMLALTAIFTTAMAEEAPSMSDGAVMNRRFKGAFAKAGMIRKATDRNTPAKNPATWKPLTEKYYGWDNGKWELQDTYAKTYDERGNTVKEIDKNMEGETIVTEYVYDEHDKVVWRESRISSDGETFENSMKTQFTYDPILTDLITERTEWMWMNGDWRLVGNNYKRTVKRDDKGNITSVVISTLFQDYYDPIEKLTVTYGDDGKAAKIHVTNLAYNGVDFYWTDNTTVDNIVWENTDGQIADVENLFIGGNRIKSAVIIAYEEDYTMTVEAEYSEDSAAYTATMTLTDEEGSVTGSMKYEPLENEGYRTISTVNYPEDTETELTEVTYDEWGNNTKSYSESRYGDEIEIYEDAKGTVEYDSEGVPVSYELTQTSYDQAGRPFTDYIYRGEFSDYMDVAAAVGSLTVADDGKVEYFDLTGRRLEYPAKGTVCIRVQNGSVSKIVVR